MATATLVILLGREAVLVAGPSVASNFFVGFFLLVEHIDNAEHLIHLEVIHLF